MAHELFTKILKEMTHPDFKKNMSQDGKDFLVSKGLPLDTKLTQELRKECIEYLTDKTIKRAKERS